MGSDSDLPIVEKGINVLKDFGVPYEVHVMSAHRTPDEAAEFSKNAAANGFGVIIAAAGMAAALPGVATASFAAPKPGVLVNAPESRPALTSEGTPSRNTPATQARVWCQSSGHRLMKSKPWACRVG